MLTRRTMIKAAAGLVFASASWRAIAARAETFEVTHTDEEWRKLLTPAQYNVWRKSGTEHPWTSPLLKEHRAGLFACAGCDLDLFSSKTKFESGTGWPSFWAPLQNAVGEERDSTFGMVRTAVHCRRFDS
jgi:peptide-methionine (R)-S-oxide reductase